MTLDLTKPVQTRDGRPVRILATDLKGEYPIAGAVLFDNHEQVHTWTAEGVFVAGVTDDNFDLVNVKRVAYVNMYDNPISAGFMYGTRVAADNAASPDRTARIRVEFTPGQMDE